MHAEGKTQFPSLGEGESEATKNAPPKDSTLSKRFYKRGQQKAIALTDWLAEADCRPCIVLRSSLTAPGNGLGSRATPLRG